MNIEDTYAAMHAQSIKTEKFFIRRHSLTYLHTQNKQTQCSY